MAFVPGHKWDLFVSYAHVDNEAVYGTSWVTDLVDRLQPLLRMRLGGADEIKVFRDSARVKSNSDLAELLINVRESALFLAIVSPSYVTRPWTLDEVKTFRLVTSDSSRLFSIEYLPPPAGSYPPELSPKIQQWFWEFYGERKLASPLTLESNPKLYRERLEALADDIAHTMIELRTAALKPIAPTRSAVPDAGQPGEVKGKKLKTVLLAKTVGALEESLDGLRDALLQYDDEVRVISAGDYWQSGLEFCAAFQKDIDSADLFVQLLGKAPAKTPPDLPEGYTRFQVREAIERRKPILQWRPADLDLNTVLDSQYREMLEAETVQVSGIDSLRKQILEFAKKKDPPGAPIPSRGTVVFVNAHAIDREVAERIQRELLNKRVGIRFPAALREVEGAMSAEQMREDLAESLTESDVVVFLYSKATRTWIRAQLSALSKSRREQNDQNRDKRLEVVYIGPPSDNIHPDIYLPNVQMVECPPDGSIEPLMNLIWEAVP